MWLLFYFQWREGKIALPYALAAESHKPVLAQIFQNAVHKARTLF